jgi:hypothetical protein
VATVCFVDESVRGGYACMCGVCFSQRGCARSLHADLRRRAGWRRGELKLRKLLRALGGDRGRLRELLASAASWGCVRGYRCVAEALPGGVLDGEARERLLLRLLPLLAGLEPGVVEIDEMPLSDTALGRLRRRAGLRARLRMRSSSREPGVQVADLFAGACCLGLRPPCP